MSKKQSRYFLVAMVALSIILSTIIGCRQIWAEAEEVPPTPTDKQPVSSITITGPAVVQVGATIALDATVSPSNAEQVVTWSSSRTANATVDTSGTVTGVAVGYTDIEATATDTSGISALHRVSVIDDNTEVEETTSLALAAHDFRITLAEANAPLSEADAITKAGALAWALDVGSSAALTIDATELANIQTATVVNRYPLTFIATHSASGATLTKTIQVEIRNESVEIEPAGDSLLATETVIPVNGSITLQAVSSSGAVLTGFAWSIAAGGDPDGTGTAIEPTTGVVTAGATHGVVTVEATKDGETVQHTVTVVDLIVTGAQWVESTESIELYATIEPVVTDLASTSYSWNIDTTDQPSLTVESTGGTKSNTATLKGQATLKLDVPVSARVTAGVNGATTTTAVLSKSYPIDVVDLVFTAPASLPSNLRVGESATTFGVEIQPQPTAGETLDVPAGNMVSWSQTPSAPSEKLKITPQADTTKADIIGEVVHTNVVITATYGAGSEDITTTHGVDVLAASAPFILQYTIPAGVTDFRLPLRTSGANKYNLTVNWGDNSTPTTVTQASHAIHDYSTAGAGTYTVTISGDLQFGDIDGNTTDDGSWGDPGAVEGTDTRVPFYNSNRYLAGIISFGSVQFINNPETFAQVPTNFTLPSDPADMPYLKGNMSYMFYRASTFNQNIGNWNVSEVTDMEHMFCYTDDFNQPIGNWNVGEVTNMESMFSVAESFNQDISNWDVKNVENMHAMFAFTTAFNNGGSFGKAGTNPLNWVNTSKVEYMSYMFYDTTAFNQDVSNWDVSTVTTMEKMFLGAQMFNNGGAIGTTGSNPLNWAVDPAKPWQVDIMSEMFRNAGRFNQDISGWDVRNVTTMEHMFRSAYKFNQNISGWNVGLVSNMDNMFNGAIAFNNGGASMNKDANFAVHTSWDWSTGLPHGWSNLPANMFKGVLPETLADTDKPKLPLGVVW